MAPKLGNAWVCLWAVVVLTLASVAALEPHEIRAVRESKARSARHNLEEARTARKFVNVKQVPRHEMAESRRQLSDRELRRSSISAQEQSGQKTSLDVAASQESAMDKAERIFLEHEKPQAVHDCGIYGNDCNYKGTGADRLRAGTFMKTARTQSLASFSQPSQCSSAECLQLAGVRGAFESATARGVPRLHPRSGLPLPSGKAPVGQSSPGSSRLSSAQMTDLPSLSQQDIAAMARELYAEATDPNRKVADDLARQREYQIRHAVAEAVDTHQNTEPHISAVTQSATPRVVVPKIQIAPAHTAVEQQRIPRPPEATRHSAWVEAKTLPRHPIARNTLAANHRPSVVLPHPAPHTVHLLSSSRAISQSDSERILRAALEQAPETSTGDQHHLPGAEDNYNMWDNLSIYNWSEGDALNSALHVIAAILVIAFVVVLFLAHQEKLKAAELAAAGDTTERPGILDGVTEAAKGFWHSAEEIGHTLSRSASETFENARKSFAEEPKPAAKPSV